MHRVSVVVCVIVGLVSGWPEPALPNTTTAGHWVVMLNQSAPPVVIRDAGDWDVEQFSLTYRCLATTLHILIFVLGVAGNIVLIAVVSRSRVLQTPTYAYLLSLAVADLLVICTAIPEAIVFHHLGKRWLLGQVGCAIFIFLNFLGINAGSLSILALTVERYIAICQPYLARKMCTMERTTRLIIGMWCFAILYCCPWLGLTEVKPEPFPPHTEQCEFRLPPETYVIVFAADLVLFYLVPLLVAVLVYAKIGAILYRSLHLLRHGQEQAQGIDGALQRSATLSSLQTPKNGTLTPTGTLWMANGSPVANGGVTGTTPLIPLGRQVGRSYSQYQSTTGSMQYRYDMKESEKMQNLAIINSRTQILRILVVIVVLFALSWLPFRGLLVYNSFVKEPWLDIWYLLFAKTLIYVNSAINPFVYNAMSKRFRLAVLKMLCAKHMAFKASQHGRAIGHEGAKHHGQPVRRKPAGGGQGYMQYNPSTPSRKLFNANILFNELPGSSSSNCRRSSGGTEQRRTRHHPLLQQHKHPILPRVTVTDHELLQQLTSAKVDLLQLTTPSRACSCTGHWGKRELVTQTRDGESTALKEDDPMLIIYKGFYDCSYHSSPN